MTVEMRARGLLVLELLRQKSRLSGLLAMLVLLSQLCTLPLHVLAPRVCIDGISIILLAPGLMAQNRRRPRHVMRVIHPGVGFMNRFTESAEHHSRQVKRPAKIVAIILAMYRNM
jgi:hypothetical protein